MAVLYGRGDIDIASGTSRLGSAITHAQREHVQTSAAKKLMQNLESNDILDLVDAAIKLHDKFTLARSEKIGLQFGVADHSELERTFVIDKKWRVLNQIHNNQHLKDPQIFPKNVREFLIKFQWLSMKQLPSLDDINTEKYLNWNTFFSMVAQY